MLSPEFVDGTEIGPPWTYLDDTYVSLDLRQKGYWFEHQPLELAAVYVLHPNVKECDRPILGGWNKRDDLIELLRRASVTHIPVKDAPADKLRLLGKIIEHVPVRHVYHNHLHTRPSELRHLILGDYYETAKSGPAILTE
jgi:hypothetical protein